LCSVISRGLNLRDLAPSGRDARAGARLDPPALDPTWTTGPH
jgi:hypothetical protein